MCPIVDEEVTIRLKGRLRPFGLSAQAKHPVLLSMKQDLAVMMLRQEHEDNYHEGTEYVRNIIQQDFWNKGLWNALRSMKHECVKCRKVAARPIHLEPTDLPKERVNRFSYPFHNTRKDYFGPFDVKILRKLPKNWFCLFTCLTNPAIHIEVVEGLDTGACMMALTRFMARWGRPHTFGQRYCYQLCRCGTWAARNCESREPKPNS